MKMIKRDNVVIHYTFNGMGDVTLLFVHGSYIDHTYWKEQIECFKDRYTVVTMDLAGHGQSGRKRERWSIEGFAKDVIAVLGGLHLKNVILIGHSLGADINLMAATSAPQSILGFIAIESFKNAATGLSEEDLQQAAEIMKNLKKNFEDTNEQYAKSVLLTSNTPQDVRQRIIDAYRGAYKPMGIPTMKQIFKMYTTEKELLPKLKFTLYLINVDYLPTHEEPLKRYAQNGYKLYLMEGTSHYPMLENPQVLNELLQDCIDEITGEQKNTAILYDV